MNKCSTRSTHRRQRTGQLQCNRVVQESNLSLESRAYNFWKCKMDNAGCIYCHNQRPLVTVTIWSWLTNTTTSECFTTSAICFAQPNSTLIHIDEFMSWCSMNSHWVWHCPISYASVDVLFSKSLRSCCWSSFFCQIKIFVRLKIMLRSYTRGFEECDIIKAITSSVCALGKRSRWIDMSTKSSPTSVCFSTPPVRTLRLIPSSL